MISPRDHSYLLVNEPKVIKICNLPDKEFKIAVLRKLSELQENTERQFNKIGKTIYEENETFLTKG